MTAAQQLPAPAATVTHQLGFGARVTACCGRPASEFGRWDLVMSAERVTCPAATAVHQSA